MKTQNSLLSSMDDAQLVQCFNEGNDRAFDALMRRYEPSLKKLLCSVVRDEEVEKDVLQDTYIKALQSFRDGSYKERGQFKEWIQTVAYRCAREAMRKNRYRKKLTGGKMPPEYRLPEWQDSLQDERIVLIRQIILTMDVRTQQIIRLHTEENQGFEVIAVILKMKSNLVRSVYYKAMEKLKKFFSSKSYARRVQKKYFSKPGAKHPLHALVQERVR